MSAGTDASQIDSWGPERTVHAEALCRLLLDRVADVRPSGIRLRMVVVEGLLDFTGAELHCPLVFDTCRFDSEAPFELSMATVPSLAMRGCKVPGLSGRLLTVKKGLELSGSFISEPVLLRNAEITGGLTCEGTVVEGVDDQNFAFDGRGMKVEGGVRLSGFDSVGAVDFGDANITGPLVAHSAVIRGKGRDSGDAIYAAGIRVSSGAYLDSGFHAEGAVNLLDAQITGQLSLRAATIKSGSRVSFSGDRISVTGGVWLDQGGTQTAKVRAFSSSGPVRLSGATIGGQLSFVGASVNETAAGGVAVWADGIKVASDAAFRSVKSKGAIRIDGSDVNGWLNFDDACIDGDDAAGVAVSATGIKVTGGISLDSMKTRGAVVLTNVVIGGDIRFDNAHVLATSSGWNRRIADALRAGRGIVAPKNAATAGGVLLTGGEIGGALRFVRATITSIDVAGVAVTAQGLKVGGGLWFGKPPTEGTVAEWDLIVDGAVVLTDATVTGQFGLRGAQLTGLDTHSRTLVAERLTVTGDALFSHFTAAGAMVLSGSQISGELAWLPGRPVRWSLDLEGVTTDRLADDGQWPEPGKLKLNGFKYSTFSGDHASTLDDRLGWIRAQYTADQEERGVPIPRRRGSRTAESTMFSSQPYEQLGNVYQNAGQNDEARQVRIAANTDRRRWGGLKPGAWWLNKLFDMTIRFGYKSWRAVIGLLFVYAVAVIAFTFAQSRSDLIIPKGSTSGIVPVPTANHCSGGYPCFYPAGFAIDTVVPIVNVHQADEWTVNGHASWGWAWVGGTWVATGLGWALATLFVAGYTGLVRTD